MPSLMRSGTQKHTTYVVFLQVHHDSHRPVLEFEQFAGLDVTQAVDTGHAITDGQHGSHLIELLVIRDSLQLIKQHLGHFAWFNLI